MNSVKIESQVVRMGASGRSVVTLMMGERSVQWMMSP